MKPRNAPYPPIPGTSGSSGIGAGTGGFNLRQPDRRILEHDRRRAIEVRVLEERDRLEEENEAAAAAGDDGDGNDEKEGEDGAAGTRGRQREEGEDVTEDDAKKTTKNKPTAKLKLTEEEIEARLDALRTSLTREMEDDLASAARGSRSHGYGGGPGVGRRANDAYYKGDSGGGGGGRERRKFKGYEVHEQAEAKFEEMERFKRAVGIRDEGDKDERDGNGLDGGSGGARERKTRDIEGDREHERKRSYRDWDRPGRR